MNRFLVATLLAALWVACADAETYWVDGAGADASDSNPGTQNEPWHTLPHAIKSLAPGDTLMIKGSVYRETVMAGKSGEKGKPITLRAAPGERVVISGADRVKGWRKCTPEDVADMIRNSQPAPKLDKVWVADIDWIPTRLYEGAAELSLARTPDSGWWPIKEGFGLTAFSDPDHLNQTDPKAWDGWTVAILEQAGGGIVRIPVAAFDPETHKITLAQPYSQYRDKINPERDRYYMENHIAALDGPGQFVLRPRDKGCRLFLWPARLGDDGLPAIEATRRNTGIDITGANHLVLDGLEVRHSNAHGIETANERDHVGITIQNCIVHHNEGYGINTRKSEGLTIRRSILRHNSLGLVIYKAKDTLVEENDIGWNRVDGLAAANDIANLTIRRNYIHDHYLWGHPDNIQFWSNVTGLRIVDNVMLNAGQTMMSDGLRDVEIRNNMFVGSHAVSMIVGGQANKLIYGKKLSAEEFNKVAAEATPDNVRIVGNTVCASAPMPTNLGGIGFILEANIFAPLHGGPLFMINESFKTDYNLLWPGPDYSGALVILGEWRDNANSLAAVREKFKQEEHGLVADPRFASAPKFFAVTDYRRVAECTTTRFITYGKHGGRIAVGDHVELDFDGVPRKVTEVGDDWFAVDKPLALPPQTLQSVANWGDRTDFTWDLRLAEDSPARKAGPDGRDVGCSLDIQSYIRGDFNGDGKRDLPELPKD